MTRAHPGVIGMPLDLPLAAPAASTDMAEPERNDGWLILWDRSCGPDAGLPEDRERARRVLDLAAIAGGDLTIAVVEPGLGAADVRLLISAGCKIERLGPDPVASLKELLGQRKAGLLLATSTRHVDMLRAAGWNQERQPLVLDLHDLPSATHSAAASCLTGIKADGHSAIVAATLSVDRSAIEAARLILTPHQALVPMIEAARGHGTPEVILAPISAAPDTTPFGSQRTRSIVHPGVWAMEPGTPDEDGAHMVLHQLALPHEADLTMVGLDLDPRFRAVALGADTAPPSEFDAVVARAAVACVARRRGIPVPARTTELERLGVPVVATIEAGGSHEYGSQSLADAVCLLLDNRDARDDARIEAFDRLSGANGATGCRETLARHLSEVTPHLETRSARGRGRGDPGPRLEGAPGSLSASPAGIQEFENRMFPGPFLDRIPAIRLEHPVPVDRRYRLWRTTWNHPTQSPADRRSEGGALGISILLPTWNTPGEMLEETIESVLVQTDPRWQLCIADDASSNPSTHHALDRLSRLDSRVEVVRLQDNRGIAGATSAALSLARLDWIGLLDHDDLLAPDAVEWVLRLIESEQSLDVVYTDEDKIDLHGLWASPFLKPDWNPDLLLSCNYMTHFTAIRRDLVNSVGGFRPGYDGSQDYDLFLRVTEKTDRIGHVARPLYSWRQIEGSTSVDTTAKPAAHGAGRRALEDALARRSIRAEVSDGFMPTWHRVRYLHDETPLVTVVIPTRDHVDLVRSCVKRLRQTARYSNLEILVVDNQSTDPATVEWLDKHESSPDGAVVRYPHEFSYARQMNLAACVARGQVLLMLNNDARPRSSGWFAALLEHALRPEVGVVGGRLLFPDGRAQHEGIILNVGGPAYNLDSGSKAEWGRTVRDVIGVTGAAMMCRTSVFHEAGGFDERLRVAFNDVDFCLRVGELGYRLVYTPFAELDHKESASRGALHPIEDEEWYLERWGKPYSVRDPFYNHIMDLMNPTIFRV